MPDLSQYLCYINKKENEMNMLYLKKLNFDFVYCEFCLIFDKLISLKIQVQEGVGFFFPILCKILQKEQLYDIIIWEYHISYVCATM